MPSFTKLCISPNFLRSHTMLRNVSHQLPNDSVKIFSSTALKASNFALCNTFRQLMHCTFTWECFISVLSDVHNFYFSCDTSALLWRLLFETWGWMELCLPLLCLDTRSLTFWRRIFFLILAHPVYKMWIIQEPNTLELWNKLHFEEKKRIVYTMFKIFITYICWINI